jgi:hypothetical protein
VLRTTQIECNRPLKLSINVSFAEGATLGVRAMTAHGSVFVAGPV